jgi:hypothetical protein
VRPATLWLHAIRRDCLMIGWWGEFFDGGERDRHFRV